MKTCAVLALTFSMEPNVLPGSQMADLTLQLRFTNTCQSTVQIFPTTAQMDSVAGWGSTQWRLRVTAPKDTHQQELRAWYGPPAEPPEEKYYREKMVTVSAGGYFETMIRACWIPNRLLKPENLARATLDPKGMDQLNFTTEGASVVVLNEDCAGVRQRQVSSPTDFLRPGVLLFVPPTRSIEFSIGYSQKKWVGFLPPSEFDLMSNKVEVKVGN